MKVLLRLLFTGILFIFCIGYAHATHLMGGMFTYKNLGNNKIAIQFTIYRDASSSSNAALDDSIQYMMQGVSSKKNKITKKYIKLNSAVTVVNTNACASSYKIQKGVYNDTITEGSDTAGYYIWYNRQARNYNIDNIFVNTNVGMTWQGFIPPKNIVNSSPRVSKDLVPIICANKTDIFNAGIYDPDGDSLVYSFITPYDTGSQRNELKTTYNTNYSVTYPFGTTSKAIKMDSTTGEITAVPKNTGNYVLAIQVDEYRVNPVTHKSIYLGNVVIDLQFVVNTCSSNPAPVYVADTGKYKRTVNIGQHFCFMVKAFDTAKYLSKYDTITLSASGSILSSATNPATFSTVKGYKYDSSQFCWTPTCNDVTFSSPHLVTVRLADQGCNIVEQTYSIYVKPRPFLSPPKLNCIDILGSQYVKLAWDTVKRDTLWNSYNIYRKKNNKTSTYTKVKTISNRLTTSWTDSTALNAQDTSYSYYITSANDCKIDGATSDTFLTIQVRSTALTPGKIKFNWNNINKALRDSFVVYGNTGTGWKIYDTVKTKTYTFSLCDKNLQVKLLQLVKSPSCASNSGIAQAQFDTARPLKNSIINTSVTSWNKVSISFNASTSADVAWYRIYRSANGGVFKKIDSVQVKPSNTTYTYSDITAAANQNSYCYDVQVVDSCGHGSFYGPHCVEKLSLAALEKAVKINWSKYRGYTLGKQELYRYSNVTKTWVLIATPKTTDSTYTDNNLSCAKVYTYKVVGYKTGTGTPPSNSDSESIQPIDTIVPAVPAIKFVSTNSDNTQTFRFTSVSDKDIAKYVIYRWTNDTGFKAIDTVTMKQPDSVSYLAKNIRPDKNTYSYGVAALDSCGNRSAINRNNAVELNGKITSLHHLLRWHNYKGVQVSYYVVARKVDNTWNMHYDSTGTDTSYTDTSLVCNKVYTYRIQARLKNGEIQVYSDTINLKAYDTIPPDAPTIQYVTVKSNDTVEINFKRAASNKVKYYSVYVSSNGGLSYMPLATIGNTGKSTYTVKQGMANARAQQYTYYITATDSCAGNVSVHSSVHATIWLNATSGDLASKLYWAPYKGFGIKKYYIQRNYKGTWITIDSTSSGSDTSYTDTKNIICSATYGYRVIGLQNGGSSYLSYSDSVSATPFDTIKPAVVDITSASVVDSQTVNLSFHTVPDPDVRLYDIYYRVNHGSFKLLTVLFNPSDPVLYTHNSSSINANRDTISYMVVAIDTCGSNISRSSETHTLIPLSGKGGNYTGILKWSKYRGFTAKNYLVERLIKNKWTTVATLPGTDSTYTDGPVPCQDQYYRVRALDKSSSAYSISDSISVKPFDTVRPAIVDIISASTLSSSSNLISFHKVPDKDVQQYDIYSRTNHGSFSLLITIHKPTSDPVTYIHSGINTGTDTFSYMVLAKDSCSANVSRSSETHRTMSLSGSAGDYTAYLKWSKYRGFSVKNYLVERIIKNKWTAVATLPATDSSYTDQPVSCQTQYYRIRALDNATSAFSLSDSISVSPYDTIKPAEPVLQNLTVTSNNNILISWQKSASNDVRRYDIYRSNNKNGTWKKAATTGDVSAYTDKVNTGSDTVWCYAIRAVDSCANNQSGLSSSQCVNLLSASVNSCYQKINLSWTGYSGWTVKNYLVYRKDSGHAEALIATLGSTASGYTDSIINNTTWYTYRILAVQQGGTYTSYTNAVSIKIFNYQGTSIRYASKTVSSATNGSVVIRWQSFAGKRFYKYYRLYSKPATAATYTLLQDNIPISKDSFVHNGIDTKNADYDYYVQVVDSCGNISNPSVPHQTMNLSGTVGQLIHRMNWTAYRGWPVDRYIVERIEKGIFTPMDTVKGTDTLSVIFPAPCNHVITYRIKAVNAAGDFAYSDTISRLAIDTIPADAAIINNASVLNGSSIKLNFTGADSPDVFEYIVQYARNGVWGTAGKVLTTPVPQDAYSFVHSTNTLNDYYSYTVITLDSCLNATMTDTFSTIQLKGKPLQEANYLHWNKFKGYGIKNYIVMNYQAGSWKALAVLSSSDTALIHDSLHCYQPYYYKIMGLQNNGNLVTLSDSIQLTPFDTIIPPASQLRVATVNTDHSVTLNWRYDRHTDIKYFEVWRSINGGSFNMISRLAFDSSYTDKGVYPVKQNLRYYIITVDSCNSAHRSPASDTASLMKLQSYSRGCVPEAVLSWTKYNSLPGGTDSVVLYRELSGSNNWVRVASFAPNITRFTDLGVKENVWYSYKLVAYDGKNGLSSSSDTTSVSPWVYPTPGQTKITYTTVARSDASNGAVYIEWTSANTSDSFLRGYHIYHRTDSTQPYTLVGDVKDLNVLHYTHTGINTLADNHDYLVTVYNVCNNDGSTKVSHQPILLTVKNKNLEADIQWSRYRGVNVFSYELYRSVDGGNLTLLKRAIPKDTTFTDTNIYCTHQYTYVVMGFQNSTLITTSDSFTIKAFDNIVPVKPHIYFITTDTTHKTAGAISLSFTGSEKNDRKGYKVFRSENGSPYHLYRIVEIVKKGLLYWQDKFIDTRDSTYSYYFTAIDSCGNESVPSDTHTVVHLEAKGHSQYIQLDWSAYRGWKNWKYLLEKEKPNKNWAVIDTFSNGEFSYHDSDITCHTYYNYRIRSIDEDTAFFSFSNQAGDTGYETVAPMVSQLRQATVIATGNNDGAIKLDWNASASDDVEGYYIFRSTDNTNWTLIRRLNQQFSFTDSNLNTLGRSYYYRIQSVDSCGNLSAAFSGTHKSIVIKSEGGNQSAQLTWSAYEGWKVKRYNLYRDGAMYRSFGGDTTSFTDTMVLCINNYQYYVEAIADSGVQLSALSNTTEVRPYDRIKPRPVYLKTASVYTPNHAVYLEWDASSSFDVKTYLVYRKSWKDGQLKLIDSTANTFYYDSTQQITGSDCYYIFAVDHCGNMSIGSNLACLIILQGQYTDGQNSLNWNDYQTWPDGIASYNVLKKEDLGEWFRIGSTQPSARSFTDNKLTDEVIDYCYQVQAVEKDGKHNATSRSTTVCLHQDPIVYIPNAFSPVTTYGLNDKFGPRGSYIRNYHMQIYNRWGEVIYQTDDSKDWDGYARGELAPEGVYMYRVVVDGYNGKSQYYKGNLTIIR